MPEVLLSGNHSKIAAWRLEQSRQRTARRRPDLYARYQEKQRLTERLSRQKRNNIHMMETLRVIDVPFANIREIIHGELPDFLMLHRQRLPPGIQHLI